MADELAPQTQAQTRDRIELRKRGLEDWGQLSTNDPHLQGEGKHAFNQAHDGLRGRERTLGVRMRSHSRSRSDGQRYENDGSSDPG